MDKNSANLKTELNQFISENIGFGKFIFRDGGGRQIATAKNIKEFVTLLKVVPEDSIVYHALEHHFSFWLMARGEIKAAKMINPMKIKDYEDPNSIRQKIIDSIIECQISRKRGKVIPFNENEAVGEENIVTVSGGSLGGKGRGIAFINNLIYNLKIADEIGDIIIRTPRSAIIGTEEFESIITSNSLYKKIADISDYSFIKEEFCKADISSTLKEKLKLLLLDFHAPLAVRSSSLSEDSIAQPFSGVFDTYFLPNNHPDINVRLEQLVQAVKLVYASIYSPDARIYFKAVNHKLEEEKMAVIIQELVGSQYGSYYYPHISGIARSFNFFPVSHQKPEDGYSVIAVGLGGYVVGGGRAYRFTPKYPEIDPGSIKDLMNSSQQEFFCVDMEKTILDYKEEGELAAIAVLDIDESKKHGTLKHCASEYDINNDRLVPGIHDKGVRIVNFANILKFNYIPLAATIDRVLNIMEEALGTPVEIEFAVDLNKSEDGKASLYLLQAKPLVEEQRGYEIQEYSKENLLVFSENSIGNGCHKDIHDLIFVDVKKFDRLKTEEMAKEIEYINLKMLSEKTNYVLIGPGRWGTRDKFLGIPVVWSQISNAKVIIEMDLQDFPLDASLGSHFFHNISSMNIGYYSIKSKSSASIINWDLINSKQNLTDLKYFKHIRFEKPLFIQTDGRKGIGVISL
jgi:hypothetical protein